MRLSRPIPIATLLCNGRKSIGLGAMKKRLRATMQPPSTVRQAMGDTTFIAGFFAELDRVAEAISDYGSFLRLRAPDEDQGVIDRAESYIRIHSTTPPDAPTLTPTDTITTGAQMTNAVDGALYVYVPAGTFFMGLDEGGFDEKPRHEVHLDAFWIMQTEVTNEQYEECVAADAHVRYPSIPGGEQMNFGQTMVVIL
ncbi:MAG: SUMF1/EgtB/PvdO family nonheme iron enzyme [Caldilineaceae bacterium]